MRAGRQIYEHECLVSYRGLSSVLSAVNLDGYLSVRADDSGNTGIVNNQPTAVGWHWGPFLFCLLVCRVCAKDGYPKNFDAPSRAADNCCKTECRLQREGFRSFSGSVFHIFTSLRFFLELTLSISCAGVMCGGR